jgi:hypothetical protein
MAAIEFSRDRFRKRLSSLIDEYEAMLVLLAQMNPSLRNRFQAERQALSEASKRELQKAIIRLNEELKRFRRETGATQRIGTYAPFLKAQVQNIAQRGFVLSLPIYMALFLFKNYPNVSERVASHDIPIHAFLEIDYEGSYESPEYLQFQIPEAMLFEDMCSFWNEASEISVDLARVYNEKLNIKRRQALLRGAVSSAFYMVEAFCNGIAFDVFLNCWDSISDNDRQRITEWDVARGRPKYQTVRDKILHYPRMLVGSSSPLIQENNSPELAFFMTSAKELRDAIVHANAAPDYTSITVKSLIPPKWQALLHLNRDICAEVVDCSISVIEQIASAIDRQKSVFWLQRRGPNGLFHASVFE